MRISHTNFLHWIPKVIPCNASAAAYAMMYEAFCDFQPEHYFAINTLALVNGGSSAVRLGPSDEEPLGKSWRWLSFNNVGIWFCLDHPDIIRSLSRSIDQARYQPKIAGVVGAQTLSELLVYGFILPRTRTKLDELRQMRFDLRRVAAQWKDRA